MTVAPSYYEDRRARARGTVQPTVKPRRISLHGIGKSPKPVRKKRRCVFCGDRTRYGIACGSHADLIAIDPYFSTAKAPRRELA